MKSRRGSLLIALGLSLGSPTTLMVNAALPALSADAPRAQGALELRRIELMPPRATVEAYVDAFSTRTWHIGIATRGAAMGMFLGIELRPDLQQELFDPSSWRPDEIRGGFIVTPSPRLLTHMTAAERAECYQLLAQWPANKPERWPLVVPDEAGFNRLEQAGVPRDLVRRARELSFAFAGGFALSDFSVLATEFPDRTILAHFLEEVSKVTTVLPRLNLQHVRSLSDTLAYWTVDHRNTAALPLLEALIEADTGRGIELSAILPGTVRVLLFNLSPLEIHRDISTTSYVMAASVAAPGYRFSRSEQFLPWFQQNFPPVAGPPKFGDVLVMSDDTEYPLPFACAFVADDLVFTRDPVGLGVWRFMRIAELVGRNPHFAGRTIVTHRRTGESLP